MTVKVKVCGITRLEDALAAGDLGAAAVGFVFWSRSPRCVSPSDAAAIARRLPPDVASVGVFVNPTATEVREIVSEVGLSAVQLHGDETPGWCETLPHRLLKAVRCDDPSGVEAALAWPDPITLLLDAHDPVRRGGTGRVADWRAATALAARRRIFLAGGLTPENVVTAVTTVRPYGVDVSSGVEVRPGIKDHARLRALFAALASMGTLGGRDAPSDTGVTVRERGR